MRTLPLYDSDWVLNHIEAWCYGGNITVEFKDLVMIHNDAEYNYYNLIYIRTTYNNFIVFKDKNTNEFFKFGFIDWENAIKRLIIVPAIHRQLNLRKLLFGRYNVEGYNLHERHLLEEIDYDYKDYRDPYIDAFFKSKNIDTNKLAPSVFRNYRSWVKSFFPMKPLSKLSSTRINYIISKATKDDDVFTMEDFKRDLYSVNNVDEYNKSAVAALEKHSDDIYIKYLLLKESDNFTGKYKISYHRYNDNKKVNTFDMMDVELHMISDRQGNIAFIRNNMKEIKRLLKLIIYNNSKSKRYANYMKIDSMTLSPDSVLIVKFIFKDKLEKLLEEEKVI